jgi:hypothetical protein
VSPEVVDYTPSVCIDVSRRSPKGVRRFIELCGFVRLCVLLL